MIESKQQQKHFLTFSICQFGATGISKTIAPDSRPSGFFQETNQTTVCTILLYYKCCMHDSQNECLVVLCISVC